MTINDEVVVYGKLAKNLKWLPQGNFKNHKNYVGTEGMLGNRL